MTASILVKWPVGCAAWLSEVHRQSAVLAKLTLKTKTKTTTIASAMETRQTDESFIYINLHLFMCWCLCGKGSTIEVVINTTTYWPQTTTRNVVALGLLPKNSQTQTRPPS